MTPLMTPISGEPVIPPGSRAVLIGVPRYQDTEYRSYTAVGNSVEGMYWLLVESGLCGWREEQVEKIPNPTNAGQLMARLRRLAAETTGVLLLYFVGHGQPSKHGELCLAITDTDYANPDTTGLEYTKIKSMLHADTPATTRIAILDCCYSGTVIGLGPNDLADLSNCAGAYTLTAADERAQVPPDDQGNPRTAFTGELLDLLNVGIPDSPPNLTLGTIFPHLHRRLAAKGLPRPNQRSDDSAAAFVFARNATMLPPTPAERHTYQRLELRRPLPTTALDATTSTQIRSNATSPTWEDTDRPVPGRTPTPQPSGGSPDEQPLWERLESPGDDPPQQPIQSPGLTGPPPGETVVYRLNRRRLAFVRFFVITVLVLESSVVIGAFISGSPQGRNILSLTILLLTMPMIGVMLRWMSTVQLALTRDGVYIRNWKSTFVRWSEIKSVLVEDAGHWRRRVRFVLDNKIVISPVPVDARGARDREFDQKVSTIRRWHDHCRPS